MVQDIIIIIRERKRKEWTDLFTSYFDKIFTFIDKNGKLGIFLAFCAGVVCVLAFKVIFVILILLAIIAGVILAVAQP